MSQGLLDAGLYAPGFIRPVPANWANDIYWNNDRDNEKVVYFNEQAVVFDAGIGAPTAITVALDGSAPAGARPSTFPFTFGHRYRYVNRNKKGPGLSNFYVSNPSPSGFVDIVDSNDSVELTVTVSSDPKVTDIALEYSPDKGRSWLFLQYVANSTTTHKFAVDVATSGILLPWDELGHEIPPPQGRVAIIHKNTVFKTHFVTEASGTATTASTGDTTPALTQANSLHKWGAAMSGRFFKADDEVNSALITDVDSDTGITLASGYGATLTDANYTISPEDPNVVNFSKVLLPESFPPENSFRVLVNTNDQPTAMQSYGDDIIFYGAHSMEGLKYLNGPGVDGTFWLIDPTRGAVNQECVIKVDSIVYALDRVGIHRYRGNIPEHISLPIDEILEGRTSIWDGINWENAENKFSAAHNPDLRQIMWFVTLNRAGVSSDMNAAIVYNYDEGTWVIHEHLNSMRAATSVRDQNGQVRPLLASEEGGLWIMRDATTDGVPAGAPTVSGIIAPDATTTNIPVSGAALYVLNQGLANCAVIIEGVASGTIASNTADAFVLDDALSAAPASGTPFFIAPIQMKLLTRAVSVRSPADKSVFTYLEMLHEPPTDSGAEEIKVKVRLDYSTTPANFAQEAKELLPGVRVEAGALDVAVVSLKQAGYHAAGYIRIPMPSVAFHVAEIEILTEEPRSSFSLNAITIRGQNGEISEI